MALSPLRQVEIVTTRVFELEGFHKVLHQLSSEYPSMELDPVSVDVGPLPQQYVGGPALRVCPAERSGV